MLFHDKSGDFSMENVQLFKCCPKDILIQYAKVKVLICTSVCHSEYYWWCAQHENFMQHTIFNVSIREFLNEVRSLSLWMCGREEDNEWYNDSWYSLMALSWFAKMLGVLATTVCIPLVWLYRPAERVSETLRPNF